MAKLPQVGGLSTIYPVDVQSTEVMTTPLSLYCRIRIRRVKVTGHIVGSNGYSSLFMCSPSKSFQDSMPTPLDTLLMLLEATVERRFDSRQFDGRGFLGATTLLHPSFCRLLQY